jgi:hypothetical protein
LFLVGIFLGGALLLSPIAAAMLGTAAALYEAWRLARARHWRAFAPCALAAALPVAAALGISTLLHYVDGSPGAALIVFGLNRVATRNVVTVLFLSFGPVLLIALSGAFAALVAKKVDRLTPVGVVLAVAVFFYFLVDIPEHQSAYVVWRASHVIFIGLTALVGVALQEWWTRQVLGRTSFAVGALVIALAALPTVLIDLYNTQDVWNRAPGPGFRWTVLLSPGERDGLEWIKRWTAARARVQVEPNVRGRDTWAYVPAFAERRMSAGLPTSMLPLAKYESASRDVQKIYQASSAKEAYDLASMLCVDYLVIGPPERKQYPALQPMLDASPQAFPVGFRNDALAIYAVTGSENPRCDD